MKEANNFALVPKQPSSLEKAEPGSKRILCGMVADTLALAKKEQAADSMISVAMYGWGEPFLGEAVEMILRQGLATQSKVEFKFWYWATDFIEAARDSHFDLFILCLNPGIYSRRDTAKRSQGREMNWDDAGSEEDAYQLIGRLKREFSKPVIVVSNGMKYDSKPEIEKAGADAVFWMPFGMDEFVSALSRCLKVPRLSAEKSGSLSKPVFTGAEP